MIKVAGRSSRVAGTMLHAKAPRGEEITEQVQASQVAHLYPMGGGLARTGSEDSHPEVKRMR
jgi:hypothetical protein